MTVNKRAIVLELSIATAALLVVTHVLFAFRGNAVIGKYLSTIVAVLFLYTPIAILWLKKRPIDFLDSGFKQYLRSFFLFVVVSLIVFPAFFVLAYGWETWVMGHSRFYFAAIPTANAILFQLLIVALPEEFYFRGYFQSAINTLFAKRWRVLGVDLGWGWIITALVFALAHTLVYFQWWHFAIFFPALLFGYLRERTGSITAPVLFHALSNIVMDYIARSFM